FDEMKAIATNTCDHERQREFGGRDDFGHL
ncbi:MAG: hypothetical protein RIS46_538, partial [Actinomycetota bacterium]